MPRGILIQTPSCSHLSSLSGVNIAEKCIYIYYMYMHCRLSPRARSLERQSRADFTLHQCRTIAKQSPTWKRPDEQRQSHPRPPDAKQLTCVMNCLMGGEFAPVPVGSAQILMNASTPLFPGGHGQVTIMRTTAMGKEGRAPHQPFCQCTH